MKFKYEAYLYEAKCLINAVNLATRNILVGLQNMIFDWTFFGLHALNLNASLSEDNAFDFGPSCIISV